MSRQVPGKRPRSNSRSSSLSPPHSPTPAYKARRITREPPSPDPTPNPKRVKLRSTELECDDGSNKENIPPDPIFSSLTPTSVAVHSSSLNLTSEATASASGISPRALRASRRASTRLSRHTPVSRRGTSARPSSDASSNVSNWPVSSQGGQVQSPHTPTRAVSRLSLTTPPRTPGLMSPAPAAEGVIDQPTCIYTQARALLRPQRNGNAPLTGRDEERTQIFNFLAPFVSDRPPSDTCTSLYVTGAPGTGKTALVNEVLSSSPFIKDTNVPGVTVRVIHINCMALGGTKDVFTRLWERCVEELGFSKDSKRGDPLKDDWSQRFANLFQDEKCVLVLDEIDHLATSTSTSWSVSQMFAIAATPQLRACLRIIGISNTHTLIHSKPSANTRTIHFEPYTATQMKAILSARLTNLPSSSAFVNLFSPATLALLTMKISSQTGDIRTVFSVARRALDLAVAESTSSPATTVTPAHILAALKASHACIGTPQGGGSSEIVVRVRNLGLHARFALAALLLAARRIAFSLPLSGSTSAVSSSKLKENTYHTSGSSAPGGGGAPSASAIDITALHGFYTAVLSRAAGGAFCGVGRTEFTDLVGLMEGSGLVELAQGRSFGSKTGGGRKNKSVQAVSIANGVRAEELVRGLIGSSVDGNREGAALDVREQEVKHVWENEIARIAREVKTKLRNTSIKKADFEGAEED
ncbi:P-loop containing nucleoside triphosphate hydrolase protein [Gautieria morchelliformis]|nr:P-loop containing nucleoside triphosphate hydrolase protein [Gautieria morchelliformis]